MTEKNIVRSCTNECPFSEFVDQKDMNGKVLVNGEAVWLSDEFIKKHFKKDDWGCFCSLGYSIDKRNDEERFCGTFRWSNNGEISQNVIPPSWCPMRSKNLTFGLEDDDELLKQTIMGELQQVFLNRFELIAAHYKYPKPDNVIMDDKALEKLAKRVWTALSDLYDELVEKQKFFLEGE